MQIAAIVYTRILNKLVSSIIVIMSKTKLLEENDRLESEYGKPQSVTPHLTRVAHFGDNGCSYKSMNHAEFKGFETLDIVAGKTLGSGTYAKVKAAWCNKRKKLVSKFKYLIVYVYTVIIVSIVIISVLFSDGM